MKKPSKSARPVFRTVATPGWDEVSATLADAFHDVMLALGARGLGFQEKRQVLTWAAEAHGIDPGKLQGRENPR